MSCLGHFSENLGHSAPVYKPQLQLVESIYRYSDLIFSYKLDVPLAAPNFIASPFAKSDA